MPRPTIDLEPYRDEIERRLLQSHHTHAEVLAWLETEGVTIALKTLKRRCRDWGATDRALTSDVAVTSRLRNSTIYVYERFMRCMHAYEMHAYETHAHEMHAHTCLSGTCL